MASISSELEQLLLTLAPETKRQRQSALLRPLNLSLIVISAVGLIFMAIGGVDDGLSYAMLIGGLGLNCLIIWLERSGKGALAALLFSGWVNLGILLLIAGNLFRGGSLAVGLLFASQLALSVMLAGLLLGLAFAVLFTTVNAVAIVWLFAHFFAADPVTAGNEPAYLIRYCIPLIAFLVLIMIITWLYQRALDKADERIGAARKRIIQDELIRRDLAIARELQLRLFPPPPITNQSLRIASRSEPARETSGDFYDFIDLSEGLLGIVVADVTGKSVAAALMMALARVTIRSEARRHTAPSEVLRAANETISRDHSARQLITAFYGVLDTRRLTLRFANAGHPYPLLRRGDLLHEIEISGMPLGGRPDTIYDEFALQLEAGDQLFLISDGLVEERNAQREMFGYGRLTPAIMATPAHDPQQALDDLWQSVARWRGAAEQADDITLLVVQAVQPKSAAVNAGNPVKTGQLTG